MASYDTISMLATLKRLIHEGDDDEFTALVDTLQFDLFKKAKTKAFGAYSWVKKLPVLCTLYNRSKMIKCIRTMLKDAYTFDCNTSFALDIHVKDLAKVLKYNECENELQQLYNNGDHKNHHVCTNTHIDDYCIFEGVIETITICNYDFAIINKTFELLVEYGFNINAQGPSAKTPLHIAVIKTAPFDVIRKMIALGADINVMDKFGYSPFHLCIKKRDYRNDQRLILKLLKLWLYQNPDVFLHEDIIQHAVSCDLKLLQFSKASTITHEKFLLPWLHRAGFRIARGHVNEMPVTDVKYLPVIDDMLSTFNKPRSLKVNATVQIRKTYPGLKLHETLKHAPLPSSIRDYILMEELNTT
ncbi:hypothetical protein ACF0H5_004617 [Mactra antiquata]